MAVHFALFSSFVFFSCSELHLEIRAGFHACKIDLSTPFPPGPIVLARLNNVQEKLIVLSPASALALAEAATATTSVKVLRY